MKRGPSVSVFQEASEELNRENYVPDDEAEDGESNQPGGHLGRGA